MTYANTFPTGAKKPTSEELRHRFDGRRDKAWYVGMLWAIVAIVYGSIMFDVSLGLNLCFLIFLYISASWPHSFLAINYIRWRHRSAQCENPKWSKWSMNEATFGYMLDIAWPCQPCEPLHSLTSLPLHDTPSPTVSLLTAVVWCLVWFANKSWTDVRIRSALKLCMRCGSAKGPAKSSALAFLGSEWWTCQQQWL